MHKPGAINISVLLDLIRRNLRSLTGSRSLTTDFAWNISFAKLLGVLDASDLVSDPAHHTRDLHRGCVVQSRLGDDPRPWNILLVRQNTFKLSIKPLKLTYVPPVKTLNTHHWPRSPPSPPCAAEAAAESPQAQTFAAKLKIHFHLTLTRAQGVVAVAIFVRLFVDLV